MNQNQQAIFRSFYQDNELKVMAFALDQASMTRDRKSEVLLERLHERGITHTPCGVKYTKTGLKKMMSLLMSEY